MTDFEKELDRRLLLKGAGALAGTAALSSLPFGSAMAAGYPDQNINVVVPTRAGGGADRLLRGVSGIWKKHLKTNFEPGFFRAHPAGSATRSIWASARPMPTI
jgi:hypothetical protein